MRLAVISDTHGNLLALEAVLADLEARGGWDHLWFLGDLAAFGPRPAECVRRIKAFADAASEGDKKGTFRAIRGNTDRWIVHGTRPKAQGVETAEDLPKMINTFRSQGAALIWALEQMSYDEYDFLRKLPGECDLHVPGFGHVIGYHGTPGDDEGYLTPESTDEEAADALLDREGRLGIGGHIHRQMDRQLSIGGWRVINVGSVGMSFETPGIAQYGMLTFTGDAVQVDLRGVPYDLDAVIAEFAAVGHPAPEWATKVFRRE
ncbi:MAG: metallophosphoesterase family protein [Anaerolinea sp.]|nr:metallophosphoesterase family protein [Anaerolinea sp.]